MQDIRRFELFTYVAQMGSLTKAAEQLGLSKSVLSKQIKQLKYELQTDLFTRSRQRLVLNQAGQALLEQCLRLKKELDATRALCQQFNTEPSGSLRVVAFEHFAKQLILPKLSQFLTLYPNLQLEILLNEHLPDFEKEQVDLAVGFSLPTSLDIVRGRITTTRYVLCAAPSYFKSHGKPQTITDLINHHYIAHSGRPANRTIRLKKPHGIGLKPYLKFNNVASMLSCAKQGLGLVQLPLYLVSELLALGELEEVLADMQATHKNVYYYYPKYRHVQSKVSKFIQFFLKP